jgi:T-complex protein 1 subunit theta
MTSFMRQTGGASFVDLLKDGAKHFSGVEEAILRNIEACKQLAEVTSTSFGPNGMNKMVVNHLDRVFVTSDAFTILKEMEVQHPAAKLLFLASEMQKQEVGDHSNWAVMFAGALLAGAEAMVAMGIPAPDIVDGFTRGYVIAKEALEKMKGVEIKDLRNVEEVAKALNGVVGSKLHGLETIVTPLVARACVSVVPKDATRFSIDNVRVAKVPGGTLSDSCVVHGFVIARGVEGTITHIEKARIAVFSQGIEPGATETKGTVLLKSAEELLTYSNSEEAAMAKCIDEIASAGVNVVVSGAAVNDLAMHFMERKGIMVIKNNSKFELRRICKFSGAAALSRVGKPNPEEIGSCDHVIVKEIGGTKCTVMGNDKEGAKVSTVLVRSSTSNQLDDVQRAIDSGVSAYRMLCKDGKMVPGAGAVEVELARAVATVAESTTSLDQYGLRKFGEAFECVPRVLADNSAQDSVQAVAALYAEHEGGKTTTGIDVVNGGTIDAAEAGILDHAVTKLEALRLATDAAVTVLRVDQIIMAKQAGGPKPPSGPMGM